MKNVTLSLIRLTLLLLAWGLSGSLHAQAPANDDPCGAVVLTPQGGLCLTPTPGTTNGSTLTTPNGYQNTEGCTGTNRGSDYDVWYRFTTAATGLGSTGATITVSGNAAALVRLFSASSCAGPFTPLACTGTARNTTAPVLTSTALTANTTYYVRVSGYDRFSTGGPFTICLTDGPGFVPCPQPALSLPSYTDSTNTAATFTFTPAANNQGPYTATLRDNTFPFPPPITFPVAPPSFTVPGLVPGVNYHLTVTGTCATGGTVAAGHYFTVPAPNDEPCGARVLAVDPGTGCTPITGATSGATATVPNGYQNPGCAGTNLTQDVWYKFRTAGSGPGSTSVVLTVNDVATARQLRLFAAASCSGPFTELACSAPNATRTGAAPLVATGLVPNTTYYVSVAGAGGFSAFFTICASAQLPILPCVALDGVFTSPTFITPTTALLVIRHIRGGTPALTYTITYTPAGGPPLVLTVPYVPLPQTTQPSTSTLLTGLLPGTTYTVSVVANCFGGGQSPPATTTFTTPPAPPSPAPANDDCPGATALPVSTTCTPVPTTNLDATGSMYPLYLSFPNCASYQGADVWYTAVVPANGVVEVTTGPASGSAVTNTALSLYSGTCGLLTALACNDDISATNLFSQARATGLVPGSTVYARVWRPGMATLGAFTICATTDVSCPLPTGLAATALTPTSATLTATLPAGNTYVLTYQPAGGTTQTLPVTAAPIPLTGLLPGTTYTVTLTGTCTGAAPGTVRLTFTTPPVTACAGPGAVYVSNVGNTTAGVGFTLDAGASSYALTYQATGGPVQTLSPAPTASPVALTGLVPGTAYTVCLTSTCANGLTSVPVCAPAFTTTGTAPTCAPPTALAATGLTPTTASLSFTPAAGVSSYVLTYQAASGPVLTLTPAPTASPVTLTGLLPGTTYTVTLVSACPSGPPSAPAVVSFTTPTVSPTCPVPTALVLGGLTPTTATLSFTGSAGATGYVATATAATGAAITVSGAASPLALTGLLPGTAYTVTVTASCGAGSSSAASAAASFTTLLASRQAALAAQLGLYPNPAHHAATLVVPAALLRQAGLLTLSDALGRAVQQRYVSPAAGGTGEARAELDLTGLPSGVYWLRLLSSAGPLTKRLVVE